MLNPIKFFDKLEDAVRGRLSHFPILYALIGGVGIVLFWRGVWHTTDWAVSYLSIWSQRASTIGIETGGVWWDGPLSLVLGTIILLTTGAFVSNFIGNEIIISGLRGEKKLNERTAKELRNEVGAIAEIRTKVREISTALERPRRKGRIVKDRAQDKNKKTKIRA